MALNMDAIRKRREDAEQKREQRGNSKGPGFYKPKVGETILALAPPIEGMNGEPFLEYTAHGDVGAGGGTHVCLSYDNPILNDPTFQEMVEKRNGKLREKGRPEIVLDGYCPSCCEVSGESDLTGFGEERLQKMRAKPKFACSVMEWGILKSGKFIERALAEKLWQAWPAPQTVMEKTCGVLEVDGDVTDPDHMVLLQLTNTGVGFDRYNVRSYSPTIREPLSLDKPLRAALRKGQEPGGDLDMFRMIANFTKSSVEVEAMLRGVEVDRHAAPAEAENKPQCFGTDCDPDEPVWCQPCPFKVDCAAKKGCAVPGPSDPDAVFPFDGKTWKDRDMTDPALDVEPEPEAEPEPPARPAGRPLGKPTAATQPPAPAARPAVAVTRPAAPPVATKPAVAAPTAKPAAAPAARPAAAPAARPASAPPAAARPATAPAARPAATPLPRAAGAPAPTAKPAAAPAARPAAAPAARPAVKPVVKAAPPPEPDPEEELEQQDPDYVPPGPGEEQDEITEPVEGEMPGDDDDELNVFETELRGG